MYYYYYYYYGAAPTSNLSLKLNFGVDDNPIPLSEFNSFIDAVNEIHKRVIFLTQPEYQKSNNLDDFEKIKLLSYHQLQINHFCRKNPFEVELLFDITTAGIAPYLTIIKILAIACKRYGKDYKLLRVTYTNAKKLFKVLFDKYNNHIFDNELEYIFDTPVYKEENNLFNKIQDWSYLFLTHSETEKYYNYFCKTLFLINDLSFLIEPLDSSIYKNKKHDVKILPDEILQEEESDV
jgi:hypothetical protein